MNLDTVAQTPLPDGPEAQSNESKRGRGGKRPGAGRKPDLVKRLVKRLSPLSAGQILDGVDVEGTIAEIMKKGSFSLKQRTLADLMDRAWGRPAQAVSVSGGLVHAHTGWRPIANWTDEELAWADRLSKKLLPASASNTAQNQIESKPAIEAEVVANAAL